MDSKVGGRMECYSSVLNNLFALFKGILSLIQIIGPIVCLVSLISKFGSLVVNPEDEKMPKQIINSFKVLIALFLIPLIVNYTLQMVFTALSSGTADIGSCYKNATFNNKVPTYQKIESKKKSKLKSISGGIIFVGDSRTCGMYLSNSSTVEANANFSTGGARTLGDDIFICQDGMSLAWLKSTGMPAALEYMKDGKKLVIMMGTNDYLVGSDGYVSYINDNYDKITANGGKVYFVSVNPMGGSRVGDNGKIKTFNENLKNGLNSNVGFIDTYNSGIAFSTTDGVHYLDSTNKDIYEYIKNAV